MIPRLDARKLASNDPETIAAMKEAATVIGFATVHCTGISPDRVLPSARASGKKQILQDLAKEAARCTNLPERQIFDVLLERERLGTTGVGGGIAIPHGRHGGIRRSHQGGCRRRRRSWPGRPEG